MNLERAPVPPQPGSDAGGAARPSGEAPALRPAAPPRVAPPRRARRQARRWLRRAVLVLLALGAAGGLVLAWLPQPLSVDAAAVERGPLRVTVDEEGHARVEDRHVVSAPLAGNLARIRLEPGDDVARGQVITRIVPVTPPLMDERTRGAAEARLAATLAAQRQARAQIARAEASLEFARRDLSRQRQLVERGALPRAQLDPAELAERAAAADLESLRFGLRVAENEAEMARAALRRISAPAAGKSGDELEVTSPVAGRVLKVMHESEGVVQAGTPLLEVGDPAALEIVADVLTTDAVRILPGAAVTIDRWGGAPLEGRVRRVEPSAFTRPSALGVDEQRTNVVVDLAAPRDRWLTLGDGYRVEVHVVVWEGADVVKAPASALFRRGAGWAVFRVEDGLARLSPVEIGQRTPREVQVLAGLEPGAVVVVHPSDRIADGAKVAPR